ncbi:MAG: SLBB domain-containing protein, partial [Desulfovibrionales bacterium]|nr:SLBB domain-containing protein [Desulfovibrionales bacterium]
LQFLDKARGIHPVYGSYRDISIIRGGDVIKKVDLYSFLTKGTLDLFQFKSGDVISVGNVKQQVTVAGDVKRPFKFELIASSIELSELFEMALPNPTATNVNITRWDRKNRKMIESYFVDETSEVRVSNGDVVDVYPDHVAEFHTVSITGEHNGMHTLVVGRNASLGEIVQSIQVTDHSNVSAVQLFRKSVAQAQKQLLEAKLQKLEEQVLTTPSITKEESLIRSQESKGILTFIDRARKVEPKGLVVINEKTDLDNIALEDGDTIHIPAKSHLVLVQGEVAFPGAQTIAEGMTAREYVDLAGELTERADTENILLIHQNGRVQKIDCEKKLKKVDLKGGDSLLIVFCRQLIRFRLFYESTGVAENTFFCLFIGQICPILYKLFLCIITIRNALAGIR